MSKSEDTTKTLPDTEIWRSDSENTSKSCHLSKIKLGFHDDESSPPDPFPDTELSVNTGAGLREGESFPTSDTIVCEDLISLLQTPCSVDHRPDNFTATLFPSQIQQEIEDFTRDTNYWSDENYRSSLFHRCDLHVQNELNNRVINWWVDDLNQNIRLVAYKNRANGECLLDSVSQSIYGCCDSKGVFRLKLAKIFRKCLQPLYNVYAWNAQLESRNLGYGVSENIIKTEFSDAFRYARTPGKYLEEIHIFLLSNIIRRPIILYSVKELAYKSRIALQYSNMSGIYLPLFMSRERSLRNAIILGYTLNHFSALLPVFTSNVRRVPLFDKDGSKLPIKYARCFYDTSDNEYSLGPDDSLQQRMATSTDDLGRLYAEL